MTQQITMTPQAPTIVLDDNFATNPWQHYELMRTQGPIHKVMLPTGMPAWLVIGHSTGKKILTDPRVLRDVNHIKEIFQSHNKNFSPLGNFQDDDKGFESHMLNKDAPDHTRLRKLAMRAFTPGTVKRLGERIAEVTAKLIAQIPTGEVVNFSEALSYPLPITMICEILGVDEGEKRENFKRWSYVLFNRIEAVNPAEWIASRDSMYDTLIEIITSKRQELTQREPQDLLDELILSRDAKDSLSDQELVSMAFILLVAGHETTVTLINNALIRLATIPGLADNLRHNPAQLSTFIEEILRIDSPVQFSAIRFAAEDMIIDETAIAKDDLIVVSLLAANHDPAAYDNPEELSIETKASHIAFGHGAHFCLGAALARNEATTAINQVLTAFSEIQLAIPESDLVWRPSGLVRGRDAVPLIVQS